MSRRRKESKIKELIETQKGHRNFLKSIKRKEKYQDFNPVVKKERQFRIKKEKKIIDAYRQKIRSSLSYMRCLGDEGTGDKYVVIPKKFSLLDNYSETMKVVRSIATGMLDYWGQEITLDFEICEHADTAALFFLQIVRLDIATKLDDIQPNINHFKVLPDISLVPSKSKDVNRLLIVCGYPVGQKDLRFLDGDSKLAPVDNLGFLKGIKSQKHYLENKKSTHTSYIVRYLNKCIGQHGYKFDETDQSRMENIVSEILSNAEDHSISNNWYLTANFSIEEEDSKEADIVGEVNLTIMNFGSSLYEAFLDTKEENHKTFSEVYKHVSNTLEVHPQTNFSAEQLFTLAMMQEQVSRLNFEDESRGTGTMTFIKAFLDVGDFENKKKGYVPNLSLFSGGTLLICDNKYKPYTKDGLDYLSLNREQDLNVLPEESHLKKLSDPFPGTLLSVTIYFNKKHLDKKYGGNNG